ncbi:hypothetical protein [Micromonospora sp. LOL_024]|uniref:hypothetical protein n=1 Tax=Micromonospora sp. LOL_024 TaxID=3345412 RepID=UPI003A894FFC
MSRPVWVSIAAGGGQRGDTGERGDVGSLAAAAFAGLLGRWEPTAEGRRTNVATLLLELEGVTGRRTDGERAMVRSMRATRLRSPTDAVGTVVRELQAFHADADLRDDAVVVCLDWRGLARTVRWVTSGGALG